MHNSKKKISEQFMDTLQLIAITLIIGYGIFAVFALLFSNGILFPKKPSSYTDDHRIIKFQIDDGKAISGVYLPNNQAQYTLLYSHGNYEDIGDLYPVFENFQEMGYSVFAYDYPGYGTSDGVATVKSAYASIDAAYDHLIKKLKIDPEKIIALGRSVGGGPAVDLASRKPLGGLILESTFVTAFRVMTKVPLLPWDKFSNISKIDTVQCPVLLIHGTEDEVISFWHGKALLEKAKKPKLYLWVEGAGHNNLIDFAGKTYWDTLEKFRNDVENFKPDSQLL